MTPAVVSVEPSTGQRTVSVKTLTCTSGWQALGALGDTSCTRVGGLSEADYLQQSQNSINPHIVAGTLRGLGGYMAVFTVLLQQ